jgi:CTP:molybdopterin cytidylyltransferase MocA
MTIAAVVLAAGEGSRFDGPSHKLLAPFQGRPLVEWAVTHAVDGGLDRTVVVVGAEPEGVRAALAGFDIDVVENPGWAGGIATSLAAAVDHATAAGHDGVVIGLGDQPFIEPTAWSRVGVALGSGATIAVATYDGRRRNPVGLAAAVWPDLPTAGDEGAKVVMRMRPELVREVPCPGRPLDIDTVEDLRRWS